MNNTLHKHNFETPQNGILLSFEGLEGSGKSTQIKLLQEKLKSEFEVKVFREPGSTTFGENLRNAMLNSKTDISALAQAFLFISARSQLMHELVLPALESGSLVILDRYIDSTIAYQGFAGDLSMETVLDLHKHSPLNILPNKTILLDLTVEQSIDRMKLRGNPEDFFESKKLDFFQKLKTGYDESAMAFPERIKKINATNTIQEIHNEIVKEVRGIIKKK